MLGHWKERRIRNRLLMRELLLRAEAKRVGAPGRSGPSTVYFRDQKRRLLWSHPAFAIQYLRARKQGRNEVPEWRTRTASQRPDFTG
jgi:hypothetical protein